MKQKVLFFIQSGLGGAERMTLYIANCLDPIKYEVIIYVVGKDWGAMENLIPLAESRRLIKVSSYRDLLTFRMIKVLFKEKPSFVFSSVTPLNYRLCIASILFPKIKVIIRSDNYLYTQSFMQKVRLFLGYRFLDYLIAQTEEMRDEHIKLLWLSKSKVGVYSNPVDKDTIDAKTINIKSPLNESTTNYVFVGRINHVKGVDTLLYAFAKILKEDSNVFLYIIGDTSGMYNEYYNELLQLVDILKIKDNVVFTGFDNNPYRYVKYADCFVLSSRNEGLPNVVIEALYLGTPVAVTKSIPVISRIVENGVNGYLAEVDDSDGLAKAMRSASQLGRVLSSYTSASKEDFQKLFL